MLPLPPGLLCLSALCIYLPQPRLAGAQPPLLPDTHTLPGNFRARMRGVTGRQQIPAGSSALF